MIRRPLLAAAATLTLAVATIPLVACQADADNGQKPAGNPQNPCLGDQRGCSGGPWYITVVKVDDRQITCISQHEVRGLAMSCDWPR